MADDMNEDRADAFEGIDRVFHEKARLGILTVLLGCETGVAFNELRDRCKLTDGNLNRHLHTLQEAGLIDIDKETLGKRPRTLIHLTGEGKHRFITYLGVLEQIVSQALAATKVIQPAEPKLGFAAG